MRRFTRYLMLAALGVLLPFLGCNTGETRNLVDNVLVSTNFCFVFDCQNGILGGLIEPCVPGQEVLVDCFINQDPP